MKRLMVGILLLISVYALPKAVAIPSIQLPTEGQWKSFIAISYPFQTVLPQVQPLCNSLAVHGSFSIGDASLLTGFADLNGNPWGYLGVQLPIVRNPLVVAVEVRSTLPSRSAVINPWVTVIVSNKNPSVAWSVGSQAGLWMTPMPNQRPMGPALFFNAFASIGYHLDPSFQTGVEFTYAGPVGAFIAYMKWSSEIIDISFVMPVNWYYRDSVWTWFTPSFGVQVAFSMGGTL